MFGLLVFCGNHTIGIHLLCNFLIGFIKVHCLLTEFGPFLLLTESLLLKRGLERDRERNSQTFSGRDVERLNDQAGSVGQEAESKAEDQAGNTNWGVENRTADQAKKGEKLIGKMTIRTQSQALHGK